MLQFMALSRRTNAQIVLANNHIQQRLPLSPCDGTLIKLSDHFHCFFLNLTQFEEYLTLIRKALDE